MCVAGGLPGPWRVAQIATNPSHEQLAAPASGAHRDNIERMCYAPLAGAPHAGNTPDAQVAISHGRKRNARTCRCRSCTGIETFRAAVNEANGAHGARIDG